MRQSLRVRLIAIVLIGIVTLTLINVLVSRWGLGLVRDQAISDSSRALQQQAGGYLNRLTHERAVSTSEALRAIQQIAIATRNYLVHTAPADPAMVAGMFSEQSDIQRYANGRTTVLLPPDRLRPPGVDEQRLLADVASSQSLDLLLPELSSTLPEVVRISYMTASGTVRTFPSLDPSDLPFDWTVEKDPAYLAALPSNNPSKQTIWMPIHRGLDPSRRVISVVEPVYRRQAFHGVVIVDVELAMLANHVSRLAVEQTGFAFLLDDEGRLIAPTSNGQRQLLGQVLMPGEQGELLLSDAAPALAPVIAEMRAGRDGVVTVDLRGRPYVLAYAPLTTLGWSLGLAAPLEEITAATAETNGQITRITHETELIGIAVSLVAVVLLGLLIGIVLQRQFARPLGALIQATKSIAAGELRPIPLTSTDELGQLASSFNAMTVALHESGAEILAANQRLEVTVQERTADLALAVERLEESLATQQDLWRTLREVSTPVIPVFAGVLAMPLIGQIDQERAQHATRALLTQIVNERAHTVLLDITGVPMVDTEVAQALLQTVAASRLLGAEVVLVGVSPEVAQTLVSLGIELRGLRSAANLRSAIEGMTMTRRVTRPANGVPVR